MNTKPPKKSFEEKISELKEAATDPLFLEDLDEIEKDFQYVDAEVNSLLEKISIDPSVCFGKPCIRGTRIWVSMILDLLNSGLSFEDVIKEYPQLTEDDLHAVIAYSKRVGTHNNEQEPWWITQAGIFKDDPLFDKMVEAGQQYRKAQVDVKDIKK